MSGAAWSRSIRKRGAARQRFEARLAAQRRQARVDAQVRQYRGSLFVRSLEIAQRLLLLTKPGMQQREVVRGDIALGGGLAQLREHRARPARAPGDAVHVT
jgi:hypothetical protein